MSDVRSLEQGHRNPDRPQEEDHEGIYRDAPAFSDMRLSNENLAADFTHSAIS
jgi:hypothetical protein